MESRSSLAQPSAFPRLQAENHEVTSPSSRRYNCIAWAAVDERRWWWPDPDVVAYWPTLAPSEVTIAAFVEAYSTLIYGACEDGEHEDRYEKVALYALEGTPTHAARQLIDGRWSSKLGRSVDIAHTLDALDGPVCDHSPS
jgi:hypothetical protein